MSSILTNNGAMVALQTLRGINNAMDTTQNEISTGKTINNAKDNAALWTISKVMESDVSGLKSVSDSLSLAKGVVTTARGGAETIAKLISEIKEKVIAAQDGNADRETLKKDVDDLVKQINLTANASQFNGINMLNVADDADVTDFEALMSLDRAGSAVTASKITVDMTTTNLVADTDGGLEGLVDLQDLDWDDPATFDAAEALTLVEAALSTALGVAAELGTAGKRIEIQSDFITKLSTSLTSAVGAIVDTNMEEASARLKALQTQQQLGVQALSIANNAPQNILALFR